MSNNSKIIINRNAVSDVAKLFSNKDTHSQICKEHYQTGFKLLDELTHGGLTSGTHYIGAVSSIGKSTFVLQVADYLASKNIDIVFFSLEMQLTDIVAKLISMHTYLDAINKKNLKLATTYETIMDKDAPNNLSDEEWRAIERASAIVSEHGKYLSISENTEQAITVDYIDLYLQEYIQMYNKKPIVMVDYLQILSPPEHLKRAPDKQVIDYNISRFRTIAFKYNIPILIISSFNRASYSSRVSLQSFKESGNIEYASDTLIGLQLKGVGDKDFNADIAKLKNPREIELVISKQRFGISGCSIEYRFYPQFNYFQEIGLVENTTMSSDKKKNQINKKTRVIRA